MYAIGASAVKIYDLFQTVYAIVLNRCGNDERRLYFGSFAFKTPFLCSALLTAYKSLYNKDFFQQLATGKKIKNIAIKAFERIDQCIE